MRTAEKKSRTPCRVYHINQPLLTRRTLENIVTHKKLKKISTADDSKNDIISCRAPRTPQSLPAGAHELINWSPARSEKIATLQIALDGPKTRGASSSKHAYVDWAISWYNSQQGTHISQRKTDNVNEEDGIAEMYDECYTNVYFFLYLLAMSSFYSPQFSWAKNANR